MSSSQLLELLRQVGLTSYESEAYIALLSRKELTAEEISRITSVPITRVYGTLEQLMLKGFARIVETRPKRFHASSPDQAKRDYLNYLRRGFEFNVLQIDESLKSLQRQVEPMYVASHLQVKEEELLEPLDGLPSMENTTREYLQQAGEEVIISTALFSWAPKVKADLKRALSRGVKVKVLMQTTKDGFGKELRELIRLGAAIRDTREPWHPVRGTLIDSRDLVFVIWAAEESERYWNPIVYTPHHTKNQGLIRLFHESFLFRWNNAKHIKGNLAT